MYEFLYYFFLQVMYSYAANGKAAVPTSLSLTGCSGEILGHLNKVSGFSNWLIHKHEVSYLEAFQERKQDLVYLTADSECLIDQLEESKIYIIGGLVDRNRWKGLTLEKAKSQGIATAKLPISEHMKLTGSMVCARKGSLWIDLMIYNGFHVYLFQEVCIAANCFFISNSPVCF